MKQLEKRDGFGNVRMVEVDRPDPGPDPVLVRIRRSLISRGSELFRRYVLEEAVSPDMMGYSDAGEVVAVGACALPWPMPRVWMAATTGGRCAGRGVYLVRLQAGARVQTRKLLLLQ